MTGLEKLAHAPPAIRDATLALLDEISTLLTARDLDRAFMDTGMTRAQARFATLAIKHLDIIAVVLR